MAIAMPSSTSSASEESREVVLFSDWLAGAKTTLAMIYRRNNTEQHSFVCNRGTTPDYTWRRPSVRTLCSFGLYFWKFTNIDQQSSTSGRHREAAKPTIHSTWPREKRTLLKWWNFLRRGYEPGHRDKQLLQTSWEAVEVRVGQFSIWVAPSSGRIALHPGMHGLYEGRDDYFIEKDVSIFIHKGE